MRIVIGLCCSLAIFAAGLPKLGLKTPGIQVPFVNLKSEAEFSTAPDWIASTDTIWIPDPSKDALNRIDAKAGKLGEPISGVGKPCGGAVSAFGSLWVPDCAAQKLNRIDTKTGKITAQISSGVAAGQPVLAATADSVWVLSDAKTTLSRIDPERNQVVAELRLPAGCNALAFGESALWVACPSDGQVLRIDPRTNLIDKRIDVSAQPRALAIGEGSVWVLCRKEGKVERIDPKTNKVSKTIELGVPGVDGAIADGLGSVWVTLTGYPLTRIDPGTDKVVQQFFGDGGGAIAVGQGSVWLSNRSSGNLWRLDPKRIAATLAE